MVLRFCCTLGSPGELLKVPKPRLQPMQIISESPGMSPRLLRWFQWAAMAENHCLSLQEHLVRPKHTQYPISRAADLCSHRLVGVPTCMSHGYKSGRTSWLSSISPIVHHSSSPVVNNLTISPRRETETLETPQTPASSVCCRLHVLFTHTNTSPKHYGSLHSL